MFEYTVRYKGHKSFFLPYTVYNLYTVGKPDFEVESEIQHFRVLCFKKALKLYRLVRKLSDSMTAAYNAVLKYTLH